MTKSFERGKFLFSIIIFMSDLIIINGSYILSVFLRENLFPAVTHFEMFGEMYLRVLLLLNIVTVFFLIITKSYQFRSPFFAIDEIPYVFNGVITSFVSILILLVFMRKAHQVSRIIPVFWAVISFILLSVERVLLRKIEGSMMYKIFGLKNALIIGLNEEGFAIRDKIIRFPGQGYKFIGFLSTRATHIYNDQILGTFHDLETVVRQYQVDEVIVAAPEISDRNKVMIIRTCEKMEVAVTIVSDLLNLIAGQLTITEIHGTPMMTIKKSPLTGLNRFLKRLIDFTASFILLLIFLPLFIIIAILIKIDSKGPVFFRQIRVGKGGKQFTLFKFRSMVADAEDKLAELSRKNESSGPIFKIKQDPRVTRVGRFLRRTSLDELPQLINTLKGDMSLVGPRPPIPSEVERYGVNEMKRLEINQGITGLWQVSGRSELSFEEMVKLDIYYIENWSLWLDIKILLKTIPVVLKAKGAY